MNEYVRGIRRINATYADITCEPEYNDLYTPGSLVRIASFVTARARCKLLDAMHTIGSENVYYCDTDSIVFNKNFEHKISHTYGKDLGMFEVQHKGFKFLKCDFISAKCYYFLIEDERDHTVHEIVKFKGISNPTIIQLK